MTLLDGHHGLLGDEAMPGAQGLGVLAGIGVIGRHIPAHHGGGVLGDIQARVKTVLLAHAHHVLGIDRAPFRLALQAFADGFDFV